jgi:DNA-binding transcriptional MerR regulator
MNEGDDFMELLELQGNLNMITKTQLLESTRKHGPGITDRQLTSFVSDGLLPKSARIGSRGGAYPALVEDQLYFVRSFRKRGLSVQAVKELLPLWRYMKRAIRDHEVSLSEFEYIARETVTLPEAWYAVPSVLQENLPCPACDEKEWCGLKFRMKDGTELPAVGSTVTIGFAMAKQDEDGGVRRVSTLRLAVPREDEGHNDTSVVLGIPNGMQLPDELHPQDEEVSTSTGPTHDGQVGGSEEGEAA